MTCYLACEYSNLIILPVLPCAVALIMNRESDSDTAWVQAYTAFLGFYNSQRGVKWSKEQLVQNGNYYSSLLGEQLCVLYIVR